MIEPTKGGEWMNHVGLVGRITKTPVLKESATERKYTSFVMAINRHYRNNQGEVDADFVYCSAWGKLAEHITKYCGKGSLIGVTGRLNSRSYTNKENAKVYATEVIVEEVRFYTLKNSPSEQAGERMRTAKFEQRYEEEIATNPTHPIKSPVTNESTHQYDEGPQFEVVPENFEMQVTKEPAAT